MIKEQLPELSIVEMPGGEMENTGPYATWGFMIGVSSRGRTWKSRPPTIWSRR